MWVMFWSLYPKDLNVHDILGIINNLNPTIRFTPEEKFVQLPFLNILHTGEKTFIQGLPKTYRQKGSSVLLPP